MWIDVAKLITERVPDKTGKTLPADLETGSYEFQDLVNHGVGALFEGKVIYDKTFGHVAYGCAACCAYRGPHAIFNPLGLGVGSLGLNGVDALDVCDGGQSDISGDFWNWNTTYPSIAKTDIYGHHTGMSIGTTPAATSGQYEEEGSRLCSLLSAAPQTSAAVGCPTSIVLGSTTVKNLPDANNPSYLTGVGILTSLVVGPSTSIYNGAVITETVTPTSNSCPSNIQSYASFPTITLAQNSNFIIGSSAYWEQETFPSIANAFYDQHVNVINVNLLGETSVQNCEVQATQQYYCGGKVISTFALTDTLSRAMLNGVAATTEVFTKTKQ